MKYSQSIFFIGGNIVEAFAIEFWKILSDIAFGSLKKQKIYAEQLENDKGYRYVQTKELELSIQQLNLLMLRYGIVDEQGMPLALRMKQMRL